MLDLVLCLTNLSRGGCGMLALKVYKNVLVGQGFGGRRLAQILRIEENRSRVERTIPATLVE